jgi:bifunctional UDP-N-acetylglucosamine pyrophosphorylase/glucosamine-1-phosphate N-acetyltransferase
VLANAGHRVGTMVMDDPMEAAGINDRAQLAAAEAELRDRINERWMRRGVTMLDPERTYLDTTVELGTDVTLFPGTILQGRTMVEDGAEVGPDARLIDCHVGAHATVEHVVGRQATIGAGAVVGPFVVLRPGSSVAPDTVTGSHLDLAPDA